jgi:hypothetical protein
MRREAAEAAAAAATCAPEVGFEERPPESADAADAAADATAASWARLRSVALAPLALSELISVPAGAATCLAHVSLAHMTSACADAVTAERAP